MDVATLTMPGDLYEVLRTHLFPGDFDEHGAVIHAGLANGPGGPRLLAREVVLARDGIDYVPGQRGYRMLTAPFVTEQIIQCRNADLVYLAVHNHGGDEAVAFSSDDLASQRRGYPALLDVAAGLPVGALVLARNAIAGRLWLSKHTQLDISETRVLGTTVRWLRAEPLAMPAGADPAYDRQTRLFGDRGQQLLGRLTVAVIGAGGAGSLLVEYLARLGVGGFVVIDPERIDPTNLPRLIGATRWDALSWLREAKRPRWLQQLGARLATPKVRLMRRLIRRANATAQIIDLQADFVDDDVARSVCRCDYLFLAADSMQARLVFNAIVHAYLIPGVQVGAKVPVDRQSGEVGDVFAVIRLLTPSLGCLWCNGAISRAGLQREAESPRDRAAQRYVDDDAVVAPSVITLNATASSHAANDFLFSMTGLTMPNASGDYLRFTPRQRGITFERPRRDPDCPHCGRGPTSLLARGDRAVLPTRERPTKG